MNAPASLVPANSVCLLTLRQPQALCLFGILARMQNIKGSKQTHRSRVLNLLHKQVKEFEDARMDLVKQYGKKDDKGELASPVKGANGTDVYPLEDEKGFEKAFAALQDELPFIIDGRSDQLVNMALGVVYDLLQSDDCPPLAPLRPGQSANEFEGLLFGQIIDSFAFTQSK